MIQAKKINLRGKTKWLYVSSSSPFPNPITWLCWRQHRALTSFHRWQSYLDAQRLAVKCLISRSIVPVSLQQASSMHSLTYFAQFTCMWWQAVSGIVASGFPCQAMDQILTYVHVCTYSCVWVGTHGVGTFVPHVHIVCVLLFFYFSTIPNTAEALEISSGSRMELVGGMCSWLQDHLHARINQSPASSYRHAWDTCVSAHLPVGMHVCFMCVCLGEWSI